MKFETLAYVIVENSHKNFGEDPCSHMGAQGKNGSAWATLAKQGQMGPKGGQMGAKWGKRVLIFCVKEYF